MSSSLKICTLGDPLKDVLKKFRFSKNENTTAIILKVQKDTQEIVIEEELDNCDIDDVQSSLSPQQPRFILISYRFEHSDGRVSYPLCLVYFSPSGCHPELQMLYAGSMRSLATEAGLNNNIEVRDLDDFTDEYIRTKLSR